VLLLIMPASTPVCVYVHWAKTAHKVNKRHHHMAAATVRADPCGPPPSLACLPSLVLCAASHSIPPPPSPPVQVCHVALFKWSRRLCLVFVVVGVRFAFLFWRSLLRASSSSTACLLPSPLLWSCPLAPLVGTRAATILWSSVRKERVSN
jgi:hypothetical protein